MATDKPVSGARKTIGDIAPKLAEITEDVLFGDVWERTQLSKRDRSLITLAAIIATFATLFRRLHGWAVDAGSTGGRLVRGGLLLADCRTERVHQVLPRAIVAPLREVFIDCALW